MFTLQKDPCYLAKSPVDLDVLAVRILNAGRVIYGSVEPLRMVAGVILVESDPPKKVFCK